MIIIGQKVAMLGTKMAGRIVPGPPVPPHITAAASPPPCRGPFKLSHALNALPASLLPALGYLSGLPEKVFGAFWKPPGCTRGKSVKKTAVSQSMRLGAHVIRSRLCMFCQGPTFRTHPPKAYQNAIKKLSF